MPTGTRRICLPRGTKVVLWRQYDFNSLNNDVFFEGWAGQECPGYLFVLGVIPAASPGPLTMRLCEPHGCRRRREGATFQRAGRSVSDTAAVGAGLLRLGLKTGSMRNPVRSCNCLAAGVAPFGRGRWENRSPEGEFGSAGASPSRGAGRRRWENCIPEGCSARREPRPPEGQGEGGGRIAFPRGYRLGLWMTLYVVSFAVKYCFTPRTSFCVEP
jgi:hypothetical protein